MLFAEGNVLGELGFAGLVFPLRTGGFVGGSGDGLVGIVGTVAGGGGTAGGVGLVGVVGVMGVVGVTGVVGLMGVVGLVGVVREGGSLVLTGVLGGVCSKGLLSDLVGVMGVSSD